MIENIEVNSLIITKIIINDRKQNKHISTQYYIVARHCLQTAHVRLYVPALSAHRHNPHGSSSVYSAYLSSCQFYRAALRMPPNFCDVLIRPYSRADWPKPRMCGRAFRKCINKKNHFKII